MRRVTVTIADGDIWQAPAGVRRVEALIQTPMSDQVIYAGRTSLHAIDYSGRVWATGDNSSGRLGDGTVVHKSSPVLVLGSLRVKEIQGSLGSTHFLTYDGQIYGVGGSAYVGDGTTVSKSSPVLVVGGHQWLRLAESRSPLMAGALDVNGNAYTWGPNNTGRLGVGDTNGRSTPTLVVGGHTFTHLALGFASCAGLKANGEVWTWGLNASGTLGTNNSDTSAAVSSPVLVTGGHSFARLVAGFLNFFGIKDDGEVWGWGSNGGGSLGSSQDPSTTAAVSSPVLVAGGMKFSELWGGVNYQFGRNIADGQIYCWGANTSGQLGDGTTVSKSSPILVAAVQDFVKLSAAFGVAGVKADGTLWTWGSNEAGQLGLGDTVPRSSPTLVTGGNLYGGPSRGVSVPVEVTPGQNYAVSISNKRVRLGNVFIGFDDGGSQVLLSYYV